MRRRNVLAVLLCLCTSSWAAAADWACFRGPNGACKAIGKGYVTTWSKTENIKWKFALPGPGNSSPIVSNGRVFITCSENKGTKRNLYCLQRKTGKQLWVKSVTHEAPEKMHQTNRPCSSTPAADGKRVVVWHGSAGLFCYDFEGKELWAKNLGAVVHMWGYGSSPVIHGDRVYVNHGPGKSTFMVSLDLASGNVLWKVAEQDPKDNYKGRTGGSWSTPAIVKIDNKEQLVCCMRDRVVAYSPVDGKILWTCRGLAGPNGEYVYTSLLISDETAVAMAGVSGPAMAFKLGGSGDVTAVNQFWRSAKPNPMRIGSGMIIGNHIYMANADGGTAECIDLKTGKQLWRSRLGGGAHWGSMVLADGKLYVTNQKGVTHVFLPNPVKLDKMASNDLGERSNSTPAFSDGEIFIRTEKGVYSIGK